MTWHFGDLIPLRYSCMSLDDIKATPALSES